jgi:hypothetical protein
MDGRVLKVRLANTEYDAVKVWERHGRGEVNPDTGWEYDDLCRLGEGIHEVERKW